MAGLSLAEKGYMRRNRTHSPAEGSPDTPGSSSGGASRLSRLAGRKSGLAASRWLIVGLVVAGITLLSVGAFAVAKSRSASADQAAAAITPPTATLAQPAIDASAAMAAAQAVEVPSVEGLALDQARVLLESAGLAVTVREAGAPTAATGEKRPVTSQEPAAGTLTETGDTVRLVIPPPPAAAKAATAAPAATKPATQFVVCIDPGHQAHSNSTPEPIGPGAKTTKPSVSGGATGVSTGIPEYEIALQISMNLKKRLEAAGIKVVMVRTVNDVDLSNSERAAIANKAGADLFVRVHGDGSPSPAAAGISTLYPASNQWTKPIAADSKQAAQLVQRALIASTGAVDRGAIQRTDLSGFNWSKVPSVLVEAGFLSNPVEDKLLASPHYQDKLAAGIAQGVQSYLASKGR